MAYEIISACCSGQIPHAQPRASACLAHTALLETETGRHDIEGVVKEYDTFAANLYRRNKQQNEGTLPKAARLESSRTAGGTPGKPSCNKCFDHTGLRGHRISECKSLDALHRDGSVNHDWDHTRRPNLDAAKQRAGGGGKGGGGGGGGDPKWLRQRNEEDRRREDARDRQRDADRRRDADRKRSSPDRRRRSPERDAKRDKTGDRKKGDNP
jgi:hypothetical protein